MEETLVGKTIKKAEKKPHSDECDSKNLLILEMTDGSKYEIQGGYGGYTGESCDEYVEKIDIRKLN